MLETFFKSTDKQFLAKYNSQLRDINKFGDHLKNLTDQQLKETTRQLKKRLADGEKKDTIKNEAFALVREASERVLGLRHFDVQLIGGFVLDDGKIAEMKTGEGKTLVALLPTFLNALGGKGAHVVTVNDYLAKRDAENVGQVHRFLGLSVGLIQENMTPDERRKNYECDVVYVTNSELGFDYLRDNMAYEVDEIVQRNFNFCVVDEVDSILIDEARTPLIISGPSKAPSEKYQQTARLAAVLKSNVHYEVIEKTQNIVLCEEGIRFCEQALGISDLYNPEEPWISYLLNSIKAKELFKQNKNYIINEEREIVIVDEFTGRTMVGRRWSDGLHQAIEAKENVPIQDESQTLASITYQNLFLLYEKLSGMSGTAKTEETEFEKIYKLPVLEIPTNLPVKRKDFTDFIYKNQYRKWRAVAEECLEMYSLGRPVLIGTMTIEKSELLAALLTEYGVPYRLLNARPENVESESEIIAQAGCKNAITIATNMAGRGTDIVLGGNARFLTNNLLKTFFDNPKEQESNTELADFYKTQNAESKAILTESYNEIITQPTSELVKRKDEGAKLYLAVYNYALAGNKEIARLTGEEIRKLGGLHVIGTERHDARRIDNQLRGRSGRQGDPGSSRFFLSLEDKLLRIFGGDKIIDIMENIGFDDNVPIQSSILNQSLESAQKKVEANFFDVRKQLFEYDQALNMQRNGVYAERKRILKQKNLRNWFIDYAERSVIDLFSSVGEITGFDVAEQVRLKFQNLVGMPFTVHFPGEANDRTQYLAFLKQQIQISYDLKELEMECVEKGLLREIEKSFILQQIDFSWKKHLQKIAFLRDSIGWRAYGQKDPLTEYKKEAFNYFIIMLAQIRHRVVYFVLRSKIILEENTA